MINSDKRKKVIAVVGPTASGKTAFAINLALKVNGEIISADSRLVYKGFDIGTAKPSKAETDIVKHYMIDIAEPDFDYTAGLYVQKAKEIIDNILSEGKIPVIAGGTGLYFNLLLNNYVMPKVAPDKVLREKLNNYSSQELHKMLYERDSVSAEQIYANDKKKLIRALEIVIKSGKPLNEVRSTKGESLYDVEWLGLNYPREILYQRINDRVDLMIKNGLVEETKGLLDKFGHIYNIVNTIGYREITKYLDGECTLQEAADKLKQNTRNYAKRQLTWFRRNPDIKWNFYPEKLKK